MTPLFGSAYFPTRLWIYTNFHCNLACDYCAVASSPHANPRTLDLDTFCDCVDEAVAEGFTELYVTGGEPLMLAELPKMLDYATERIPTVLLTNAMLLRGRRLDGFTHLAGNPHLVIQTSHDGAHAATHDRHRGAGTWQRTLDGITAAFELDVTVRAALTETPENTAEIGEVADLLAALGIKRDDFTVRPLLRRGLSTDGSDMGADTAIPELTVTADGLHWHPAGADSHTSPGMLLAAGPIPLARGKQLVTERFFTARLADGTMPQPYRCAI